MEDIRERVKGPRSKPSTFATPRLEGSEDRYQICSFIIEIVVAAIVSAALKAFYYCELRVLRVAYTHKSYYLQIIYFDNSKYHNSKTITNRRYYEFS